MKCKRPRCTRTVNRQGLCHVHYEAEPLRGYVDAAPTRERVQLLLSRGVGWGGINKATGLTPWWLRKNPGRVQAKTQHKVFSIPVPRDMVSGGFVPSVGTVRRIHALAAIGHPLASIGPLCGHGPAWASAVAKRPVVLSSTAAKIDAVYRRLCMQPGSSTEAKRIAKRRRWAPPLAWDDIDDPTEKPDLGARSAWSEVDIAERRERVAVLTRAGLSSAEIALRVGTSPRNVTRDRMALKELAS